MRLTDYQRAEDFILAKLKSELPAQLSYHGLQHTLQVLDAAMTIAASEEITEEEKKILRIAVLFHDAGFIHVYRGHEEKGCEMAKEMLPQFGFDDSTIKIICGMIMATRLPQAPRNILENIIADADLDYLGGENFYLIAQTLYDEFLTYGFVKDEKQWNQLQLQFLRDHHYHTSYGTKRLEPGKQKRIGELIEIVKSYQ